MFVRAYLRASTKDQNADRARDALDAFATGMGLTIAAYYTENESGALLKRPELFRLLADCHPGDMILLEQIDRLSLLNANDWERLKGEIAARRVRVVALDLPTSHSFVHARSDDFTARMLEAVNAMMMDVLAAVARKDYEDRRRRQAEGIAKVMGNSALKAERYRGRQPNEKRNAAIIELLNKGTSWSKIIELTRCSRSTLARLASDARKNAA